MKIKNLFLLFFLCFKIFAYAQKNAELIEQGLNMRISLVSFIYSPQRLSKRITRNAKSEPEKVQEIYLWIVDHIKYDAKRFRKGSTKTQTNRHTLLRKKALCGEYASLFNEMCIAQGIRSYSVVGFSKGYCYEKDDTLFNNDHAWNIVKINDKWHLVDLTYASGYLKLVPNLKENLLKLFFFPLTKSKTIYVKSRNDSYFLTPPALFLKDHLSSIPLFQLSERPVSMNYFQNVGHSNINDSMYSNEKFDFIETLKFWDIVASPKERKLWHGDSAFTFCNRNVFEKVQNLNQAGYEQVLETGKINKRGKILLSDNLNTLDGAFILYDSSNILMPYARIMIREEALMGQSHNNQRIRLAIETISPLENANQRMQSLVYHLPLYNRKSVRNYIKQNRSIDKSISRYFLQKFNFSPSSHLIKEEERIKLLGYNNELIKASLDSIERIKEVVDDLFNRINDSLIYYLIENQSALTFNHNRIIVATESAIKLRFNHEDNLDESLMDINKSRNLILENFNENLSERKKMKSNLQTRQTEMRLAILAIGNTLNKCRPFMKANTLLGKDESNSFFLVIQIIIVQLELLEKKNNIVSSFLEGEREWAIEEKLLCRKQKRLLKIELMYEYHRHYVKELFILSRRDKYFKIAKIVKHNNNASIKSIKRILKKVKKSE